MNREKLLKTNKKPLPLIINIYALLLTSTHSVLLEFAHKHVFIGNYYLLNVGSEELEIFQSFSLLCIPFSLNDHFRQDKCQLQ